MTKLLPLLMILIVGCGSATMTLNRAEDGTLLSVELSKAGSYSYEKDGEVIKSNTQFQSPFKDIVNIGLLGRK